MQQNVWIRNLLGFAGLVFIHFVSDWSSFHKRSGMDKPLPYFFLLLLYGWIVFHNRVLFDNLFLKGHRAKYFLWTGLVMIAFSVNMHIIVTEKFHIDYTLPHILSFWLYTLTGLGVWVMFRHFRKAETVSEPDRSVMESGSRETLTHFAFSSDGEKVVIPVGEIIYLESLENYIKVFTEKKVYIARLTLKQAEDTLPRYDFIRISRSQIVNVKHISGTNGDSLIINRKEMKIGKVYKRYVEERVRGLRLP